MGTDTLAFDDIDELVRTLKTLSINPPSVRRSMEKLKGFTSMLDIFERLRGAKDEGMLREFLTGLEHFIGLESGAGKSFERMINLKLNPICACIANKDGNVRIRGAVYNLLDADDMKAVSELMAGSPSGSLDEDGYMYTELPPEWIAQDLPCFAAMHWPGYNTSYFNTTIAGQDVIVQLWKGFCPQLIPGLPGGVGAEVGIYIKGKIPDLWWPDYENKQVIQYTLVNPRTNEEFFSAGPETVWWLHKWMTWPSYLRYMKDQNDNAPKSPTDFILNYTINGQQYTW